MRLGFEESRTPFKNPSQSARVWTVSWVRKEVYCPNCGISNIEKYENNRPVADFFCASCKEEFELKSQKNQFGPKVLDGAFRSMRERLASNNNPNLMLLNYDLRQFAVTNLFVVPKHFFVQEIIERRSPLAATARRAGWVGCNILLNHVPAAGKIFLVRDGQPLPKEDVLTQWNRTLFLRDEGGEARGWLIEVMKCVERIGRAEFTLEDVYLYEAQLSALYPNNRHVKQKIRQQLQVLRDHGFLDFVSRGHYRLRYQGDRV
jgi:type II restriction enzyme